MRLFAVALVAVAACKSDGPSDAELAAKRAAELKALCTDPLPRAKWDQLVAISERVKAAPPVTTNELPAAGSFKFRELHGSDGVAATTDANWLYDFEGPKRGIIGSCVFRQEQCKTDEWGFEDALKGCAGIDSYVLIRPLEERRPTVPEGGGPKYNGGSLSAEAFVFALSGADGGAPVQLGAFTFSTKLRGEVEVYRDSPTKDIEQALYEGLRKSALRQLEAMLTR